MSNANEVVERLYQGDTDGAAEALRALTDPHQLAAEVRRQAGVEQALSAFRERNADIVSDPLLTGVADLNLAQQLGGRTFDSLSPTEASAALAAAGAQTRAWVRKVAPRDAAQTALGSGDGSASSVIAAMKRARGQL